MSLFVIGLGVSALMSVFFVLAHFPAHRRAEQEYARGARLDAAAMIAVGAVLALVGLIAMNVDGVGPP